MSSEPTDDTTYSLLEESLHSISHGIGAALSLAGMVVLIVLASLAAHVDPWKIVGVSLYGATLVLLYTASTLYHGFRHPRLKRAFKILDHCAIYALIAGTYTPFLLVNLRGPLGWTLLAVIWTLALGGIALKLIWPQRFGVLRVAVYLLMGWLIVVASGEMGRSLSATSLDLLIAGGITYTVGVLFYAIRAIPFHHVIWHLFVLGGSVCHYLAVYNAVLA
ncbi:MULTISPECIES: hemolysin III family protein [unclassified Modicisalibacter]|uniref:PAQR family membrane homeostasis protein TrhA n=1 Tax=unclassified Modicisalibacter TaxID=2679913 RepID=UPI001CCCECDD|nr:MULTISPECIES: hemolysin III family protein [unclassified Modicisalibacter]MBZ9558436.1 hemolysin III family protein [Modicisalibacter sp. R2A 31.J]MBZ9575672.1 hemolysin III family protein [Modicisalibacter sp. MOD 31.J]